MKLVAYASGVPNPQKSPHKVEVLQRFVNGVNRVGDTGILQNSRSLIDADVALIQGWVHAGSPNSPHLIVRRMVADRYPTIIVDSNLFNYEVGKLHEKHYSRYSLNGVFPTTGNYFWNNPDPSRWKKISADLNLSLKDWRTKGKYILITTQRNGGWSMGGIDVVEWLKTTIANIRKHTDRPILVRGHPGDKHAKRYLASIPHKVSTSEKLTQDLAKAWCTITYNSSPGVASAIEGVPVFVTDPNPKISQAYEVANTDLSQIENPQLFERQQWVEKLCMCHWNFDEINSGEAWQHMKQYI